MKKILLLGGYGNFGKRIAEGLYASEDLILLIAGRDLSKAESMVKKLSVNSRTVLRPLQIDCYGDDFSTQLANIKPDIVIHTGGPFRGQDYRVALACIKVGSHYIDLADDRNFVCEIAQLDVQARERNVLIVSGASSVPGLSSAVIDHYLPQFSSIQSIDIAISPGNQAERGEATVRGILAATGQPHQCYLNGDWQTQYGWMDPQRVDFGEPVGKRWLANVEVPDLSLFPKHYSVRQSVTFQAGLELTYLHFGMFLMASLSRIGLVKNWAQLTQSIIKVSQLFSRCGSADGAMQIDVNGIDKAGKENKLIWTLYARAGQGPYIPTLASIILANKLLNNAIGLRGAVPCVGLFSLTDFLPYANSANIYCKERFNG